MSDTGRLPVYLTIKRAAQELGCCRATIYNRIEDKTIKAVRFGRKRLITSASILALQHPQ